MTKSYTLFSFSLILLLLPGSSLKAQSNQEYMGVKPAIPDTFQNVLDLAQMSFTLPKDAIPVPVVKNVQMHYEYAITFKGQPFEVRYSVAPIGYTVSEAYLGKKAVKQQNDTPKGLNHEMVSFVIATNVSGGKFSPEIKSNPFPPESVKREFGADWGATTLIPIQNNSFGTDYRYCIMVSLFRKDVANAYIMYLSDTKENAAKLLKDLIAFPGSFYALKFK